MGLASSAPALIHVSKSRRAQHPWLYSVIYTTSDIQISFPHWNIDEETVMAVQPQNDSDNFRPNCPSYQPDNTTNIQIQLEVDHEPSTKAMHLNKLGRSLWMQFEQFGDVKHLNEAIVIQQQAVNLTPNDHASKAVYLDNLGLLLQKRFQRLDNAVDIEEAVSLEQQAVDLIPDNHIDPDKATYLDNLGLVLRMRFDRFGDVKDIDNSISAHEQAVALTPKGHAHKVVCLNNLGSAFWARFSLHNSTADINEAISMQKQAVTLTSDNHVEKAARLNDLGLSLQARFLLLGNAEDVDEAILMQQKAVKLTPDNHSDQSVRLDNLGLSLRARFEKFSNVEDVDKAILMQRQAVSLTPNDGVARAMHLHNLALSLQARFEWFGNVDDIDETISIQRQVVTLTPNDHPGKIMCLDSLGLSLRERFDRLGVVGDINDAISIQQQVVALTPNDHPRKIIYLNNLGSSFWERFSLLGNALDIDKAISMHRQAVTSMPDNHVGKAMYLNDLGLSLQARFSALDNIADIHEAILTHKHAIFITPNDHPDRSVHLSSLGTSLSTRFERFGDVKDIDEAILIQQQAAFIIPDDHPGKAACLDDLGCSLRARFTLLEITIDIDEAISMQRRVVDLTPNDYAEKAMWLYHLGISLQVRFTWFGYPADIDEAISIQQQAVSLTPENHTFKSARLVSLGYSLQARFEEFSNVEDIKQAISMQRQAVSLIPDDHAGKAWYLYNLALSLRTRFERLGNVDDIDEAISMQRLVIALTPENHPTKATCLNSLGVSLRMRFERVGNVTDIDMGITILQEATNLIPNNHARKPTYLENLARSFENRFRYTSNTRDLQDAIHSYFISASSSAGPPEVLLRSAISWASLASEHLPSNPNLFPLQACHVLMQLIPHVAWLGNSISLRNQDINLASISQAINMAASIACEFDSPDLALEWLEQGQSIVWGQILNLRTPMDDLKRDHPELATSMERLSSQLEKTTIDINILVPYCLMTKNSSQASLEQNAQAHRQLVEEWKILLSQVRQCTGFEDFLRPKKLTTLASAANSGPVVVVNIDSRRCDALILKNNDTLLDHIHLSLVSLEKIQIAYDLFQQYLDQNGVKVREYSSHYPDHSGEVSGKAAVSDNSRSSHSIFSRGGIEDLLEMLWLTIVKPVIDKLGYMRCGSSDSVSTLPRVTWCTTGQLTFLPLHAAGCYGSDARMTHAKAYEYIVSSYTPSISALIHHESADSHKFRGITAVSQPSTADTSLRRLPGTVEEIKKIQSQFNAQDFTWLNGCESTRASVLNKMKESSWLHLACHGIQRKDSPMESAFMLYDGELNLRTISQQKLLNARLAFLSACQTATGEKKLPSEATHLAAGMLMIGYRSIVGTMWSIRDQDAPRVAEEFYRYLIACNMQTDKGQSARALHKAVGRLRDIIGIDKFIWWVPFIHLGI